MKPSQKLVYLLFFLSGLAGLIYEVIWGRWLVLVFGSTTNSLVATISAYLGGLALGSLIAGVVVDRLSPKVLIKGYALLELGVGITSLSTLWLFQIVKLLYALSSDGSSVTPALLVTKFFLTSLVILIPTTLMGATLPFLVRFLQVTRDHLAEISLSRLYAINTLGGVAGVLLAGFILLELVGIHGSLFTAVTLNFVVFLLAWQIRPQTDKSLPVSKSTPLKLSTTTISAIVGFGVSGFVSIGYQVLWTRVLTPGLGTMIYAFAAILAFYLFGLALGSFLYPLYSRFTRQPNIGFGFLQLCIGLSALVPVLVTHKLSLSGSWELMLRLLIPTLLMGLTFPAVLGLINQQGATGKIIGLAYVSNTIGAILGGYLTSFLIIPILGSSAGIALLAFINFISAFYFISRGRGIAKLSFLGFTGLTIILSSLLLTHKRSRLLPLTVDFPIIEARLQGVPALFLEDDVASVFGKQQSSHNEPQLVIDGVATTHRVSLTKYMAHLPISIHPHPEKALIIAFGMGNTYRSSLKRGLITHAVELVPSVPKMYSLFHTDNLLNSPQGQIIINDGRNYAFLTKQKYDIIVIDPPPPFNTAGSTVLHSREYYQDLAKILQPGGIVNQWIYAYGSRQDDISMAIRTFIDVFPFTYAVQKSDAPGGIFMLGSFSPLNLTPMDSLLKNPTVFTDLQEVGDKEYLAPDLKPLEIIGDHQSLLSIFKSFPLITDTHPRTEYYLLRHRFTSAPTLTGSNLNSFVSLLKDSYQTLRN